MSDPRRAAISVKYNGKKIDDQIKGFVTSFVYEDVASGASDALSLTIHNLDGKWISSWMPKKGDKVSATIGVYNWTKEGDNKTFKCGSFIMDDLSYSGPPLNGNLGAVSVPAKEAFRETKRTKTWKDITIKAIGQEIAKRAGVKLSYSGSSIKIKSLEQNSTTDCEFLYKLCTDYGLAMKVYSGKIVIFSEATYEKKKAVATIKAEDMLDWGYNTTLAKTYTGAKITYTDPKTKKDVSVKVGKGTRILNINEKVDSKSEAELKATAKVNEENKKAVTMTVTIMANTKIVASSNVNISGLEKLDGKYAVDKVTHRLANEKYTMSLELRLIQERVSVKKKEPAKKPPAKKPEKQKTYKVGDIVTFSGGTHYISSYPGARGYHASAGKAKITAVNGSGKAHPYHLIHVGSGNVYGWVDAGTFS